MFTLLGELNLWTFDDNISIKSSDFGAFRYHDKRIDHLHEEGKRSYCQKRGMIYVPTNKKGNKLKDSIKHLEEQLKDNSIIYCQWYDDCILQLMLSNGLLIQIQVNTATGDINKITFDKYLIGKLLEYTSDVIITKNNLLCTYNDSQVTIVHFTRSKRHVFDKISKLEPKLSTIDLFGPNGRRLDKKVETNTCGDLIIIWWKSTMNEVYPWSPAVKEHDRANVHLYRLIGVRLELICYIRSEFDPVCIIFDVCNNNIIHSVEQKVSRKGEVTIEWRTYEVSKDKLQRIGMISVPLPTHTSCVKFSPTQELLLLCCIDGSVIIYDQLRATTSSVKAAFIPTLASWHNDGIIFVVGNDKGQFQHFDIALSCIKSQMLSEEAAQANILDLSSYFRIQPALLRMEWNKKNNLNHYIDLHNHGNSLLLLIFQRGPIGIIKMLDGNSFTGDILVKRYLSLSEVEQATSLLLSMNWDTHSRACMHALNQIVNYLFKLPLTTERENLIQNALGSFHVPAKPISQAIEEEYGDEIRDLTRRFFHHLLRYHMFEKAFRLAIDLNDHDLFMDIHFYALVVNDRTMATVAKENAERILSKSNSCSISHSTCSRTSCSLCSDSTSDKREESCSDESENSSNENQIDIKQSKNHNYRAESDNQIPPLPVLHPHPLDKNLLSTSFTEVSPNEKIDCNVESRSLNISRNTLTTTSFNHSPYFSLSNTFFTSTSFNKPLYQTHTNPSISISTMASTNNSQSFNNISDNLMTTSFGSLSLNEQKMGTFNKLSENSVSTTLNKALYSEAQFPLNNASNATTNLIQEHSFMSTPFNNPTYETFTSNVSSDLLRSSLDNIDNNIMSTSFSTLGTDVSNPNEGSYSDLITNKSDSSTNSSSLKNIKSVPMNEYTSETTTDSIVTNKLTSNFHTTHTNLASISLNFPENQVQDFCNNKLKNFNNEDNHNIMKSQQLFPEKKQADFGVPSPPTLTSSFTNYFQSLPKKNLPLSRSTSGLADIDESIKTFSSIRTRSINSYLLQRQNSTSNILQDQHKYGNIKPSKYRLNYDFDYISLHGSCDNIDMHSSTNNIKLGSSQISSTHGVPSRFDSRHSKLVLSQNSTNSSINREYKISSNIPPLPIISVPVSSSVSYSPFSTFTDTLATSEKPKVKFSDTVTHILVPGTSQSNKQKRSTSTQIHLTDPKRELAESLPLCLGNEDYLKDFQPLPKENSNNKEIDSLRTEEGSKIKVVHFGLL